METPERNEDSVHSRRHSNADLYTCPLGHASDGHLNLGRQHWGVCHEHRLRWLIGENLFSAWRDEDPARWRKAAQLLDDHAVIEPWVPLWDGGGNDA